MRCAFLTTEEIDRFVSDDELAVAALRGRGCEIDVVPWERDGVRWCRYDLVVIRSTYNYFEHCDRFVARLEEIGRASVRLENPLPVVRWNLNKRYLLSLRDRGVAIVPTLCADTLSHEGVESACERFQTSDLVVKPMLGAGSAGTFRLSDQAGSPDYDAAVVYFRNRGVMLQPFVANIIDEGEYSLFYFDGDLSHAIVKRPASGDYRVQEEFGGLIRRVDPQPELKRAANRALKAAGVTTLYARADLVRRPHGNGWWLMELELIEPSLYLRMDAGAAERFADAVTHRAGAD